MSQFTYQARDEHGAMVTGLVRAASLDEAGRMLRGEGKFIVNLKPAPASATIDHDDAAPPGGRVRTRDVIFFAHQMAVMVQTGVPLTEALHCTTEQSQNPMFRHVMQDVSAQVQSGSPLSTALAKHGKTFPRIMICLLRASEASGAMGEMLDRIAGYLGKEQQTLKQIRGALTYPAFMMVIAVSVTIFLLAFVLPRFTSIFQSKGATLPTPTVILMTASDLVIGYWPWLLGGTAAATLLGWLWSRTSTGRATLDWVALHTPVIGSVFQHYYLSRACRTLATMIQAGVPLLDCVEIVRGVTDNTQFQRLWADVDDKLRKGSQLSDAIFTSPLVPRSMAQMIHSGEKSGRLGQVLERVADHAEGEFDHVVKQSTTMIEPVMVVTMGLLVGFVALALLLPVFSVSGVAAG